MASEPEGNDSDQKSMPRAEQSTPRGLRWWPALVLVVAIVILKLVAVFMPDMMQEGSLGVIMLVVIGPALLGILIGLWWLIFSRAAWRDRLCGLLAIVAIGFLTFLVADKSMQGFPLMLGALPTGMAAFAGAVVLTGRLPAKLRMLVVLLALIAGFGYWTLVRLDGMYGTAKLVHSWRWQPTAEDRYLASLEGQTESTANGSANLSSLGTAEWPGFRGTHRDSRVPDTRLATNWTENPPQQIWFRKVGPGWSSFSVAGKRLFTLEQRGDNEAVICLDADTGTELWKFEYPSRFWEALGGAGPRSTPTITGDSLLVLGADGMLHRLDARNGQMIWRRDLKTDADRQPPTWGFSSSPLVIDDLVFVHAGGPDDKGVLAYDAESGDLRWSVPSGDHSYSSPHLVTIGDQEFVAMVSNFGFTLIEPVDGRVAFDYTWKSMGYRTLQPLVFDSTSVLIASGMEGTRRIDLDRSGNGFTANEVWTSREMESDFNDFVIHDGHVYGFDRSIFACINLETGERNWKKGRYGNGQVLLLPDAGQLLITTETGELVVVSATPENFEELARIKVFEGKTWNHPVLVGNRLYLRNAEEAACFELPIAEITIATDDAN